MQKAKLFRLFLVACTLCCFTCTAVMAQQTTKKQPVDVTVTNITHSMKLKPGLTQKETTEKSPEKWR